MKKREVKDNSVEKRSLMYSQIFNYNMNRDGTRTIDVSAAVAGGGKSVTNKRNYYIGLAVSAIVIALCFAWSFARGGLAEYVHNSLLVENEVEMQLAEPGFVELDVDAFLDGAIKSPGYAKDVEPCLYRNYNQWKETPLSAEGEVHVSEDASLKLHSYRVAVYPESKIGKVDISVYDDDAEPTEKAHYTLHGTFKIAGYTAQDVQLGVKQGLADFSYKAASGNKAYFIRNQAEKTYNVYFVVDDIYYEMEVPVEDQAVKNVKQIFEAVANY